MSELERLAAACLLPSFPGHEPPEWILRRIDRGLGGICLFAYNVRDAEQVAALTTRLRGERSDLLIGVDEEGGDVTRLEAAQGSSFPGHAALGAVDDVELTAAVAAAIGAELAAVGVDLDFAPVADVNANAENPVIGVRSFGSEPELVARHVAAFVTGLQRQGVAACAKHFPGHGSTRQDSHVELPTVEGDFRAGLEPFRAAIAAGTKAVMTAHVRVPAVDEAPATLSPAVVGGLLRGELGYDGLVVADALEMKAVRGTVGVARGAVLAVAAGVDALLVGHDLGLEAVAAMQSALVDAVAAGELAEERLAEAAQRVAGVAVWGAAAGGAAVDRGAAREVARRALEVAGDVTLRAPPLVVELRPSANLAAGEAAHSLGDVLATRRPGTESIVLDAAATPAFARDGRPLVLVVRDAHRHAWMREAADSIGAGEVVVELGLPLWRPGAARGYVATYGGGRVSFEALADLLLDASEVPA